MSEIQIYSEKCIRTRLLEFKIKNSELQRVNADGTYSNHCSLKGYHIRKQQGSPKCEFGDVTSLFSFPNILYLGSSKRYSLRIGLRTES